VSAVGFCYLTPFPPEHLDADHFDGDSPLDPRSSAIIPETGNVISFGLSKRVSSALQFSPPTHEPVLEYERGEPQAIDEENNSNDRIDDLIGDMRIGVSRGIESFEVRVILNPLLQQTYCHTYILL
jgi:hypothetical protein